MAKATKQGTRLIVAAAMMDPVVGCCSWSAAGPTVKARIESLCTRHVRGAVEPGRRADLFAVVEADGSELTCRDAWTLVSPEVDADIAGIRFSV